MVCRLYVAVSLLEVRHVGAFIFSILPQDLKWNCCKCTYNVKEQHVSRCFHHDVGILCIRSSISPKQFTLGIIQLLELAHLDLAAL